jgi:hypothetical protein
MGLRSSVIPRFAPILGIVAVAAQRVETGFTRPARTNGENDVDRQRDSGGRRWKERRNAIAARRCIFSPALTAPHQSRRSFRLRLSESQIRIEGDNKIYERDADSFKIRFRFCPNCGSATSWHWLPEGAGSNVFWEGDRNPNTFGITVGSFADPNFTPPTYSAWEEVVHPWLGVATVTEHFPRCRPLTH